jgi:hypothetical protein
MQVPCKTRSRCSALMLPLFKIHPKETCWWSKSAENQKWRRPEVWGNLSDQYHHEQEPDTSWDRALAQMGPGWNGSCAQMSLAARAICYGFVLAQATHKKVSIVLYLYMVNGPPPWVQFVLTTFSPACNPPLIWTAQSLLQRVPRLLHTITHLSVGINSLSLSLSLYIYIYTCILWIPIIYVYIHILNTYVHTLL